MNGSWINNTCTNRFNLVEKTVVVLTKLLTKWKKHEVRIIYRKYSMPKYLQYMPLVDTAEFVHVDTLPGVFR